MTKLIVTSHNFLNAPKNDWIIQTNMFTNILNCYKIKQQWKLHSGRIHITVFNCNQKNINYKCHFWKVQTGRTIPARKTKCGTSFFFFTHKSLHLTHAYSSNLQRNLITLVIWKLKHQEHQSRWQRNQQLIITGLKNDSLIFIFFSSNCPNAYV